MLCPERLLDITRNFTLFMDAGGTQIKVIFRYQQFRAVQQIIQRMKDGETGGDVGLEARSLESIIHDIGDNLELRCINQSEFSHLFSQPFDGYTEWFKKDGRLLELIAEEVKKVG